MSLKIPPPRNEDRAMSANHVGVRAYLSPNLAQTWKNGEKYNYLEKFGIQIPKQGFFQDSNSGGVGWTNGGVSPNIWFQPIISRGYGEHWELYATWEYICTDTWHGKSKSHTPYWVFPDLFEDRWSRRVYPLERIDKIRPKLGQRLSGMGQVAPPQPTNRTRTGKRWTPIPEIQALISCKHW